MLNFMLLVVHMLPNFNAGLTDLLLQKRRNIELCIFWKVAIVNAPTPTDFLLQYWVLDYFGKFEL